MISMRFAGTLCWVIASIFALGFQYEAQDKVTRRGVLLKCLTSFSIAAYAIVLIAMHGEYSQAARLFAEGLILAAVGDVIVGMLQASSDGTPHTLLEVKEGKFNIKLLGLEVAGVVFIVSYFFQMVAFLKALASQSNITQYIGPYILFFLLPPIFAIIGGTLSKFRIPETDTGVFIIGVFYILLTSALFSAASIFSFYLFQKDPAHASFIFLGAVLFFLSMLFVSLRYSHPERYDNKWMRLFSRVLTFLGRMTLAGCAFLF